MTTVKSNCQSVMPLFERGFTIGIYLYFDRRVYPVGGDVFPQLVDVGMLSTYVHEPLPDRQGGNHMGCDVDLLGRLNDNGSPG